MQHTVLRNIGILIGVIVCLALILAIGALVYFRYVVLVPDKNGMEAPSALLRVTPYSGGTNELGASVGDGEGEAKEYDIYGGDTFYEDFSGALVQNPMESEIPDMVGLSFKVLSLDTESATLLINQEERTVRYGEEFVVGSLLEVQDGASTSYRIQITS